jgi:hypothetical protein
MYVGSLRAVSNRATYREQFQVNDADTDALIDLAGASIAFEVLERDTGCLKLCAAIGSGISVLSTGVFEVTFTATQMQGLCSGDYDVRCRVTGADGDTDQLIIGTLPVLDG